MNIDLSLYSPLIGIISKYLIDYLRSNPKVTLVKETDKKKVLAVAGLFTVIGTILTAFATGNITPDILSTGTEVILGSILSFASAVSFNEATKK